MWVDTAHPANSGVLRALQRKHPEGVSIVPPDGVAQPYLRCGCHPEVVERIWDRLGAATPLDCRCILGGTPALVHPTTGVILATGYGTAYCVRVPLEHLADALRGGAKTSQRWAGGTETDIRDEYGDDWVFGGWSERETVWVRAAYDQFSG